MPNRLHDHIKAGDAQREASIDRVIQMMRAMQHTGIHTICTNFMAYIGWFRTDTDLPERGGALVTGFDARKTPPEAAERISQEALWKNLRIFLEGVTPYAERYGIRIALHPDDPPVSKLKGVSRILTSKANVQQALDIANSPAVGVTFCQGICHHGRGHLRGNPAVRRAG